MLYFVNEAQICTCTNESPVNCLFEFNVFLQKFSYHSAACVRYNDYDNNSDENDMNIHSYNTNSNYYVIKNSQLC